MTARTRSKIGLSVVASAVATGLWIAAAGATPVSANEVSTFAGFRHHFYRGVPNRGLPSYYDAQRIGRGEDPYPGAESGYRR